MSVMTTIASRRALPVLGLLLTLGALVHASPSPLEDEGDVLLGTQLNSYQQMLLKAQAQSHAAETGDMSALTSSSSSSLPSLASMGNFGGGGMGAGALSGLGAGTSGASMAAMQAQLGGGGAASMASMMAKLQGGAGGLGGAGALGGLGGAGALGGAGGLGGGLGAMGGLGGLSGGLPGASGLGASMGGGAMGGLNPALAGAMNPASTMSMPGASNPAALQAMMAKMQAMQGGNAAAATAAATAAAPGAGAIATSTNAAQAPAPAHHAARAHPAKVSIIFHHRPNLLEDIIGFSLPRPTQCHTHTHTHARLPHVDISTEISPHTHSHISFYLSYFLQKPVGPPKGVDPADWLTRKLGWTEKDVDSKPVHQDAAAHQTALQVLDKTMEKHQSASEHDDDDDDDDSEDSHVHPSVHEEEEDDGEDDHGEAAVPAAHHDVAEHDDEEEEEDEEDAAAGHEAALATAMGTDDEEEEEETAPASAATPEHHDANESNDEEDGEEDDQEVPTDDHDAAALATSSEEEDEEEEDHVATMSRDSSEKAHQLMNHYGGETSDSDSQDTDKSDEAEAKATEAADPYGADLVAASQKIEGKKAEQASDPYAVNGASASANTGASVLVERVATTSSKKEADGDKYAVEGNDVLLQTQADVETHRVHRHDPGAADLKGPIPDPKHTKLTKVERASVAKAVQGQMKEYVSWFKKQYLLSQKHRANENVLSRQRRDDRYAMDSVGTPAPGTSFKQDGILRDPSGVNLKKQAEIRIKIDKWNRQRREKAREARAAARAKANYAVSQMEIENRDLGTPEQSAGMGMFEGDAPLDANTDGTTNTEEVNSMEQKVSDTKKALARAQQVTKPRAAPPSFVPGDPQNFLRQARAAAFRPKTATGMKAAGSPDDAPTVASGPAPGTQPGDGRTTMPWMPEPRANRKPAVEKAGTRTTYGLARKQAALAIPDLDDEQEILLQDSDFFMFH
eukprot:TRINITY_DN574_c0_g1_i2.p1 TRINITY_DN574_c0_g1~~TRINITY_DN574_c0_g1_i2.p1  ORF type:complete len:967 (+),score=323.63 TRINITY_DN574_c0_g1_i2:96-2996(+)